ncbi:hypothetical protein CH372_17360 [Leptospira meyeri]|uniref:hypothetical protein n=1 Tax=Leptospira meyeri TaxID=29508 RepID=UPI000C2A7E80|nr:hypothetical protein [Leptospira meyeri]PKA10851.1 hypothetical protein CH372_17360 [Leptospira meyeri]
MIKKAYLLYIPIELRNEKVTLENPYDYVDELRNYNFPTRINDELDERELFGFYRTDFQGKNSDTDPEFLLCIQTETDVIIRKLKPTRINPPFNSKIYQLTKFEVLLSLTAKIQEIDQVVRIEVNTNDFTNFDILLNVVQLNDDELNIG